MEPPSNKAELATILGIVNYLSRFAPNLAAVTAPMKKDFEFVRDPQQDCAFKQMKEVITSVDALAYLDPSKEVTLQVDASKWGLRAVIESLRFHNVDGDGNAVETIQSNYIV